MHGDLAITSPPTLRSIWFWFIQSRPLGRTMTKKPSSLFANLTLFALGIGLPMLILAGIIGGIFILEERKKIDETSIRITHDIKASIERELNDAMAMARTLAISAKHLDLKEFYDVARRLPYGLGIFDHTGQLLVSTYFEFGKPLPLISNDLENTVTKIFRERKSFVSNLVIGRTSKLRFVSVSVPVINDDDKVIYGISIVISIDRINAVLNETTMPKGWTSAIQDRNHIIMARSRDPEKWIGQPMSETGRIVTEFVPPGEGGLWKNVYTLEMIPVRGAYYRMENGWLIGVSTFQWIYEESMWRTFKAMLGFIGVFFGCAAVMAMILGRRILHGLQGLQLKAHAMQQGKVITPPVTPISEFNDLITTIHEAAVERQQRDEHRSLLVNELNHRVKNTLTTVQSMARRAFRKADPAAYEAFEGRLIALATSHNVLTQTTWSGASLEDLLKPEAEIYANRIRLSGPDISVSPKVALGITLAIHELGTNAAKHGSLSDPKGHVNLTWSEEKDILTFSWHEHGGPPVKAPTSRGFGSTLIRTTVEGDLAGKLHVDYDPTGLRCRIDIPLTVNAVAYLDSTTNDNGPSLKKAA
jgi:two-component sensor histidine kinase